jgi:hypothetical protein
MKKLFLFTLLCTAATSFGVPSEELVQAIHNSDYQKVQQLTKGTTFTATEQLALTDLAQNIIFTRNTNIELYHLDREISLSSVVTATLTAITLFTGCFSDAALIRDKVANIIKFDWPTVGIISVASLLPTVILAYITARQRTKAIKKFRQRGEKLKQDYDNALNIKQLLILLPVEN